MSFNRKDLYQVVQQYCEGKDLLIGLALVKEYL